MTAMSRALGGGLSRVLLCGALTAALAGCHTIHREFRAKSCNEPQAYQQARSIAPLKVPVGVDPPDTRTTLQIPQLDVPAPPPRKPTDPCLDEPPAFAATGRPAEGPGSSATPAPSPSPAQRRHRGRRGPGSGVPGGSATGGGTAEAGG